MTSPTANRKLTRGRKALMIVIDVIGLVAGVALFFFFEKHDPGISLFAFAAPLVFAGFFNLVIVLVSLKP